MFLLSFFLKMCCQVSSFKVLSNVSYMIELYGGCQKLNATLLYRARDRQMKPLALPAQTEKSLNKDHLLM